MKPRYRISNSCIYSILLVLCLNFTSGAQCTYTSSVSDLTLQCSGGTSNRSGVAYNPNQNFYYSANAGQTVYPVETFSSNGALLASNSQGADYRGFWWNSTTNRPEGNTVSNQGVYSNSLNASFYASGVTASVAVGTMPNGQLCGQGDISNNQTIYYYNGVIYKYSRSTGALNSSVTVTGLPVSISNLNSTSLIFTGISGSEVGLYDYSNKAVYFVNYTTGAYAGSCDLPSSAPAASSYQLGYGNNRIFIFDGSSKWIGYPVVNPNCSGAALSFDGGSDYITRASLSFGAAWTAEAWVKPTTVPSSFWQVVLGQNYWNIGTGFVIRIYGGNIGLETPTGIVIDAPVVANVWTHVAATYSNGVYTFYKDGVIYGTQVSTFTNATNSFYIGARQNNANSGVVDYFSGNIDEVRVWSTARSGCQIQAFMDCEIPTTTTSLVANYHFNQGFSGLANSTATTLTDASGNANTGTLNTFALTGTVSNWTYPGGVVSNYSTSTTPVPEIDIQGNSASIADGDVSASTADFTDFASAGVRVFTIYNTGTDVLTVGTPYLTGANASDFSVTALPSYTIAASGSTTFEVTRTTTTTGTKAATINIVNSDCSEQVYDFKIQSALTAGAALDFDGTNDYVSLGNTTGLKPTSQITIEAWINKASWSTGTVSFVSNINTGGYALKTNGTNLQGLVYRNGSYATVQTPLSAISSGWHHVALVFNGRFTKLYLDGILQDEDDAGGIYAITYTGSNNTFIAAEGSTGSTPSGNYFSGDMDEVRIWSVARTHCEIQTYMDCEIPTSATGLEGNYHFNQGTYLGTNTLITSLTDASGNGRNGTLNNFGLLLFSSTSNWTAPGGVASSYTTSDAPVTSMSITGNSVNIADNDLTPNTADFTNFGTAITRTFVIKNGGTDPLYLHTPWFTGTNLTDFTVTSSPTVLAAGASSNMVIAFTPTSTGAKTATFNVADNDCGISIFNFAVQATATACEALDFDGANDYVNLGTTSALKTTTAVSVEAWVYRASWTGSFTVLGNAQFSGYKIRGTGTNLAAYVYRNGSFGIATYPQASIGSGWHHVALTYDGRFTRLYLDGIEKSYNDAGATYAITYTTNSTLLGAEVGNSTTPISSSEYFDGQLDEVRFWNDARTACEIQTFMNCEISTTATGLVGNYHFSQGVYNGNNSVANSTLTDVSGTALTGTVMNFALTGTTSNWVTGGGVTTGSTTSNAPLPEMDVTGNGFTINNNDLIPSTTDYTDFGTAGTRTFVVKNTGTQPLYLEEPYFTGPNASAFSVISAPLYTIAASGTLAVVVDVTHTITGTKTATINFSNNDCSEPLYNFALSASTPTADALSFDGTNDYVKLADPNFGLSDFTLEAWIKPGSFGANTYLMSTRTNEGTTSGNYWDFGVAPTSGLLYMETAATGTAAYNYLSSISSLTIGTWCHVAIVRSGFQTSLFINGILKANATYTSVTNLNTGNNSLRLSGSGLNLANFNGSMDEVRIWNVARTQCQLQTFMAAEITGTVTGLIGNYHFNQGSPGLSNPTNTLLTDASLSASTGTLTNFALTGASSNWVSPGGVANGFTTTSAPTVTLSLTGNGNPVLAGSATPTVSNFTDMGTSSTRTFVVQNTGTQTLYINNVYFTGANASLFTYTTLAPGTLTTSQTATGTVVFTPTASGTYTVLANITSNDCATPNFSFAMSATTPSAAALNFDGTNDYVQAPHIAAIMPTLAITLEAWVKPTNTTSVQYILSKGIADAANGQYGLYLNNGMPVFHFGNGTGHVVATGTTAVTSGAWTHLAGSWDGTMMRLYVNGILSATTAYSATLAVNTGSLQIGRLGATSFSYQTNGSIDEVRIWNTARTQCEVQGYMNCEIASTASGLVANYHFNQGSAGLANATVTTLADVSGNNNNGTLGNFALTGAASNWVSPGGVTSGSTTAAAITASISVTGSASTISYNSTSPSTLNLTDFGSASSRTFVIANAGSGTLNIGAPYLSGANSSEFSVTVLPSTSLTSGTTSFVVAFTPTASGTRVATISISSNDCSKPLFNFAIQGAASTAAALNFDGTSDFVSITDNASIDFGTSTDFTTEAWIKYTGNATNYTGIVAKGIVSGVQVQHQMVLYNNRLAGEISSSVTLFGVSQGLVGTTALNDGAWHHVAMVVSRSQNNVKLYVDGLLEANASSTVVSTNLNTSNAMRIGSDRTGAFLFPGTMDEVRVWGSARTQCEIQTYMKCEIATTSPSLVVNMHFNQGAAGLSNLTTTLATDASASANTGTLNTFSLTGTTSNWVSPGAIASGFTTTSAPTASISLSGNSNAIAYGASTTSTLNLTDFVSNSTRTFVITNSGAGTLNIGAPYFGGTNASEFSLSVAPAATLAASATTSFVVLFTPTATGIRNATVNIVSNDCSKPVFNFAIQSDGSAAALLFDGSNDYAALPNNSAAWNLGSNFSMEMWVKPTTTASNQALLYAGQGCSECEAWQLSINPAASGCLGGGTSGRLIFALGGYGVVETNASPALNTWQHVAITCDGVVMRMYLNGVLQTATLSMAGFPGVSSTYRNLGGDPGCGGRYFYSGGLDELRIWNKALCQSEITNNMNCQITGTATGLTANYHFNQGIANGTNTGLTSLTDSSGYSANGTLNNFSLTGANSNWSAPGGVASSSTCAPITVPDISVSGNAVLIPYGSTLTTGTNNTGYGSVGIGSVLSRTFVISNTGTQSLSVTSYSLSGSGAAQFSISTAPSSAVSALTGSTAIVVTFSPTSTGLKSATLNIGSNDCDENPYSFAIDGTGVSPGESLAFDGSNDYVSIPHTASLNAFPITVETWIKTSANNSAPLGLVNKYIASSFDGWQIYLQNGVVSGFYFNSSSNYLNYPTSTVSVSDNNWHHVAFVVDASGGKIYTDGVLSSSLAPWVGTPGPASTTSDINLGKYTNLTSTLTFQGNMDEVRIWNTARTQCQIQQYMNCEITSTASGLLANYHFNQGIASGTNTSVTSLVDAAGVNTGSLNSFALTGGTLSNWVIPGGVASGYTLTNAPTASIGLSGNSNTITNNATSTSTLNFTNFGAATTRTFVITNSGSGTLNVATPYLTGANASEFSVTVPPASTLAASANSSFVIAFTPTTPGTRSATLTISSNDCGTPDFKYTIQGSVTPGEALNFDGSNDVVNISHNSALNIINAITIESWVKTSSSGQQNVTTKYDDSWYLAVNGGNGAPGKASFFLNNVTTTWLYGTSNISDGNWHHLAGTYDGQLMKIYVDGKLEAQAVKSGTIQTGTANMQIGARSSSTLLTGSLDELRIWSIARSQCEIQSYMNAEITSTASGLVLNFHFNQGGAGINNTGVTSLTNAASAITGTLSGFGLSGSTSNWIAPGGVTSGNTVTSAPSVTAAVISNGNPITAGSSSPVTSNNTSFGPLCVGASTITKTYTIQNSGSGILYVNAITLSGSTSFSAGTFPSTIAASGSATFPVTFSGSSVSVSNATVSINTNDCTNPNFNFAITASVNALPGVTANATSTQVCSGSTLILSGSGANTYTWSSGVTNGLAFTPIANATYTVTGTNTLTGCTGTASVGIIINPLPTVAAVGGTICQGQSFTLTASGANTYTFSNNSGTVTPVVTPSVNTTYSIVGNSTDGCVSQSPAIVTVSVDPIPTISVNSGTICNGLSFTITPNGAFSYTITDGITPVSGTSLVVSPSVTTNYTVTGINTAGCLSNTLVSTVSVVPVPTITVGNYSICAGQSATLSASGAATYSYNGNTSNIVTPSVTTSYSVTGTNSLGCVSPTAAISTVTVFANPTVAITSGTICQGQSFTLTASGANTYTFSNTSGTVTPVVTPSVNTSYSVTGTNTNGCVSQNTAAATISVDPIPTISVNSGTICNGLSYTITPNGAFSYTITDGITPVSGTSLVVSPSVTTTYTVVGTNTAGCLSSNTVISTVSVVPVPTVIVSNYSICAGQSVTFAPTGAATYSYNGNTSNIVTPSVTTSYSVTGTNSLGCVSPVAAISTVTVFTNPTVAITSGTICQGQSFTLTASGANTYTFSNTSGTVTPVVTPSVNTSYSVVGTSTDGCVSQNTAAATISVDPIPTITVNSGTVCNGLSYTITPNGAFSYTITDGITPVSGTSLVISPSVTTTYTVVGTNTAGCLSSNTVISTVSVVPVPTVVVSNYSICAGQSVTFAPTGAATYSYNGNTSNIVTPSVTTSYSVTGTNSLGCVSPVAAISTVTVFANPTVAITSGTICQGQSFTLTASGANTYTFSNTSGTVTQVVTPSVNTSYSVVGTSTDGCVSQNTAAATISVDPIPTISVNSGTICNGLSYTITPGGAFSYTITDGITPVSGTSLVVSPSVTTTYTVVGTNTAGCLSSNTVISTVSVVPVPTVVVSNYSICAGQSVTFAPTGAATYSYNGNASNIVTPSVTTSYSVTGTNSLGCVSPTAAISTVTVFANPTVAITSGTICQGQSFTLTASGANTYTFSNTSGTVTPVVTPSVNTSYSVVGTSTDGCVSQSPAIVTVSVDPIPTISVNSGTVCNGLSYTITPNGAFSYTITDGITPVSGTSLVISPSVTTTYTVVGTNTAGCLSSNTVISTVSVVPVPTVVVSNYSICAGQSVTFAPTGAATYSYNGNTSNIVIPSVTTSYSVTGTNSLGCVSPTAAITTVTVFANPTVAITSGTICQGQSFTLTASGANTYTFSNTSGTVTPVVTPSVNTSYSVVGTSTDGCVSQSPAIATVSVDPIPTISVNSGTICNGLSYTITPNGAFSYTITDGITPVSGTSLVVSPSVTTTYTVVGTNTAGCLSSNTIVSTVSVVPVPTVVVSNYSICAGQSVTFAPTGAATYSYNGNASNIVTPSVTTSYSVTGTNSLGCVSPVAAITTVTVFANPTVAITSGTICQGQSFTLSPSGANSYTFADVNGTVSPVVTPSVNTSYSVVGTSTDGCVSQSPAIATLSVDPIPTISVNSGTVCSGLSYTIAPGGAFSYTITDGITPVSGTSLVVSPSVTTTYTVVGTNTAGCLSSNTVVSTVSVVPVPTVIVSNYSICAGQSVTFAPTGAATYSYNGNTSNIVTPSVTTSYSVTGTNSLGCVSPVAAITTVTVFANPTVAITSGTMCQGQSFTLTASGANTYTFSNTSGTVTPVVTPSVNTSYSVVGTSTDGCVSQSPAIATLSVDPIPTISVNSGTVCNGLSFTITPNGAFSYTITDGITPVSGTSLVVSPSVTTTYTVVGTNTAGCLSSNTVVSTVSVVPVPTVVVSNYSICAGQSVTFAPTGAATYSYNGNTSNVVTPSVTTSYSVTGTNSLGCVSPTAAISTVTVFTNPTVAITSGTICQGQSFTLTASGANTYTFSNTSGTVMPVVTPSVNTTYSVVGTSTDGCVSQSPAIATVSVDPIPTISVNSGTICNGLSYTITPNGAFSYTITDGITPVSGTSLVVSPSVTTTYTVVGTNTAGCLSSNTVISTVSVVPVPTISIGNYSICAGQSVTFAPTGAATYSYNGNTSNIVTPSVTTSYSVTGTNSLGCVSPTAAITTVTVFANPTVAITSGTICQGQSFTLSPSGANSYTFADANGTVSPVVTPSVNTSYSVVGTSTDGCVSQSPAIATVSVDPIPTISVNSGTVCSGLSFTITPNGAFSYTITDGITPVSGTSLVVSPSVTTTYTVVGTNTAGCLSSNTIVSTVSVVPVPTVVVSNYSICAGQSVTFAPTGAATYSYNGNTSNIVTPSVTTSYSVTGTNSLGCVSPTAAISTVTVFANPTVAITSGTICQGQSFTLSPSGANSYTFADANGTVSPVVTPSVNTSYSVVGTSTDGCVSQSPAIATVSVDPIPTISVNSGTVCNGLSYTITPNGAFSYTITDGITPVSGTSLVVSPGVTTTYTVVGTNTAGCLSSNTVVSTVSIVPVPTVVVSNYSICAGQSVTFAPTGAATYSYNGNTSNIVTPSVTTSYSVTGTNSLGCVSPTAAISTVTVFANPTVAITSGTICQGQSFTLTASGANTYTFSNTSGTVMPVVTPSVNTSYSVVGTSTDGCVSQSPAIATLSVDPIPTISVNSGTICNGLSYTITPNGAFSYTITDGITPVSGTSLVVSPSVTTTYTVVGTNTAGCLSSNTVVSTVSVVPVPTVVVSNYSICAGQSVTFAPTGAATYSYNGNASNIVTPSVTTSYSVTGTNSLGCVSPVAAITTVTVFANPTVAITSGTICQGQSFTLSPSGANSYTFADVNGTVSPVVTPSVNTSYSVVGTSTDGCVSQSPAIATLSVDPIPTISVNSGTVCSGLSFTITPNGAFSYTITDGITPVSGTSLVVSPSVTTTYTVVGTNTAGCLSSNTVVSTVSVVPVPTVVVSNYSICAGQSLTFAPTGAATYSYNGNTSNVVTPSVTTSYSVTGTNSLGCVSPTAAISTVTVFANPTVAITSGTICQGQSFTLTASGANTYTFSNTSGTVTPVVTPSVNTSYSVVGTSTDGCVSQSPAIATLSVDPIPTISVNSGTVCSGLSFTITPNGAFSYTITDGITPVSGTSLVVSPSVTTTYTVVGTNTAGCLSSNTVISTVSVVPVPTVVVSNYSICAGQSVTFAPTGAATYSYNGNASNIVTPSVTTSYSVTGTNSLGCVSPTAAISTVTVFANPTVAITSGTICQGQSFTLTASGANTYTFSNTSGTVTPVVTPSVNTSYSVVGTSTDGCVSQSPAIATLSVDPIPTISVNSGTVCNGLSYTITPNGAFSYTITDGITPVSGTSLVVSPSVTTTYTVVGTNTAGCLSSNTVVSTVSVVPVPTVVVSNYSICAGQSVTFAPTGAATYSYNGNASNIVTPSVTTSYSVTGTNSLGCVSPTAVISTVTVFANPTVAITSGTICQGSSFTLSPGGASTYTFSNSTGTVTAVVNPTVTTSYSVTGTNTNGCVSQSPAVVTLTVDPTPTITVNSGTICAGQVFTMVPSGGTSYTYSGGSNTVSPSTTTTYSVIGTSTAGCISTSSAVSTVSVFAVPTITVNSGSLCSGQSFTLVPGGASTYTVLPGNTATVSPLANTSYSVSGSSTAGCVSTVAAIASLTVNTTPTVSVASGSVCEGSSFTITPAGANTYSITGNQFTVTPLTTTSYTVAGTGTNNCVSSTVAVTVSVDPTPTITVNSGSICAGQVFTLTPSGASTYSYSGGSATVSPAATAAYTVTGYSTLGCISLTTAVANITVYAVPSISVNSGAICEGIVFTITPAGASSYTYSSGSATVSPLISTSYSITGTSTAGCVSTVAAVSNVTVNPAPLITANSGTICEGSSFTIVPSGGNSYTVTGSSFTVSPLANTSYSVTGTGTNGCVSTSAAVSSVTVFANPTITASSGTICNGQSFTISPAGASTYTFSNGSGTITPVVSPTSSANYSVVGTSTDGCVNPGPLTVTVTVDVSPTVTVNSGAICVGQSFTINPGGAVNYTISGGASVVSPTLNTSYTVTGATAGGCLSASVAVSAVTVNALPNVTANTSASVVCSGNTLTLSGGGASTYTWTGGAPDNAPFSPTASAVYTVTGTDVNTCVNTATIALTVNPLPTLGIVSSNTLSCDNETITLTVSGASTFTWSSGTNAASISITPSTTTVFTVAGTDASGCVGVLSYTQLTTPCGGTIALGTLSTNVSCRGKNDARITLEPMVTFTNTHVSYLWSPAELCPDDQCSSISNLKAGTYSVTVIVSSTVTSSYTRQDTLRKEFVVLDENAPCNLVIYTGVTPNNDQVDDTWQIENIELYPNNNVTIYNRWGVKVYEEKGYDNKQKSWPSTSQLDKLQSSTYFYVIELGDGGKPLKGWVELFKTN